MKNGGKKKGAFRISGGTKGLRSGGGSGKSNRLLSKEKNKGTRIITKASGKIKRGKGLPCEESRKWNLPSKRGKHTGKPKFDRVGE